MFGIGGFELFLILLFGFLIFGPDKLPAIARTIGEALGKFRSAQEEMNKVIKTEVYDPNSDEPFKNPLDALEKMGNVGKNATSKPAAKSAAKPATAKAEVKQETFSERKARYEKERAEKKAAEAAASAKSEAPASTPAKAETPAVEEKGE